MTEVTVIFVLLAGYLIMIVAPRLLAQFIAIVVGVTVVARSRQNARRLFQIGIHRCSLSARDRRSDRNERKLMAASLNLAIDHAVLMSLLPTTMLLATRIVDFWEHRDR